MVTVWNWKKTVRWEIFVSFISSCVARFPSLVFLFTNHSRIFFGRMTCDLLTFLFCISLHSWVPTVFFRWWYKLLITVTVAAGMPWRMSQQPHDYFATVGQKRYEACQTTRSRLSGTGINGSKIYDVLYFNVFFLIKCLYWHASAYYCRSL